MGGLSESGNKAISALIELNWFELTLNWGLSFAISKLSGLKHLRLQTEKNDFDSKPFGSIENLGQNLVNLEKNFGNYTFFSQNIIGLNSLLMPKLTE